MIRFTEENQRIIEDQLENYILLKLYDKLYPKNSTKDDQKFYKNVADLIL